MTNWIYMIKEIEESAGNLYLTISKKTKNVYPEISALFHQLYKDEVHHGGQADFICTLYKESESSFNSNEKNRGILSDRIKFIKDIEKVIEEKEMYLHPVDLLKIAVELEEDLGEGHELISEGVSDPEMKKLISSLALEDKVHAKRIRDFLEAYEKDIPGLENTE